jgi:hypothetical protein
LDDDEDLYIRGIWTANTTIGLPLDSIITEWTPQIAASEEGITWPTEDLSTFVTWLPDETSTGWALVGSTYVRRGVATVSASLGAPDSGFSRLWVRGLTTTPDYGLALNFTDATFGWAPSAGTVWTSTGGAAEGATSYFHMAHRHTASGEIRAATGSPLTFVAAAPVSEPPPDPEDPADVSSVSSVGLYSTTVTLSAAKNRGYYCNGDPFFVIATNVSIAAWSPASGQVNATWRNGLMHNLGGIALLANGSTIDDRTLTPSGGGVAVTGVSYAGMGARSQGLDSRTSMQSPLVYDALRNLDPGKTGAALVITTPCTLTKAISKGESLGTNARSPLLETVNLTIVSSTPAAGSFRPSPAAASKASLFTEADIDYTKLGSIGARPSGAPTPAVAYENIRRGWQVGCRLDDNSRWMAARNNTWGDFQMTDSRNGYGQFTSHAAISAALLAMASDTTTLERRNLCVSLIQIGLDIAAVIENGGKWYARGGILDGWKLPLVFAAMVLDDAGLKALCSGANSDFAEDQHMFVVGASDIGRPPFSDATPGRPIRPYTTAMSNASMPEWGVQHVTDPHLDSAHIYAVYRNIGSCSMVGEALVAWLLGAKTAWNNDAFFNYVDRLMGIDPAGGTPTAASYADWMAITQNTQVNAPPAWHRALYRSLRGNFGARTWTDSTPPGGWPA